jgi:hypothetical protein
MRARTKALVGIPLRRLWQRRRAWTPSSRRTEIDFRKGPISTRNPTRADLPPPPSAQARGGGGPLWRRRYRFRVAAKIEIHSHIHPTAVASRTGFSPESRRADSDRLPAHYERSVRGCRGVAQPCNPRIFGPVSLPWLALCCTVLRSRWCQSGVKHPQHKHRSKFQFRVSGLPMRNVGG